MARELRRAERRADSAELFSRELINRWLTNQGCFGISRESVQASNPNAPPPVATTAKAEVVNGVTEDEFIEDMVEAGMDEATARSRWKQAKSYNLLPYQTEGELPS